MTLGHAQALDSDTLITAVEREVSRLDGDPVRLALELAIAIAAAGVLGVTARGAGRLVQRFWLRQRQVLPRSRWSRHDRAVAAARRDGVKPVAAYLPQRPTWMGDRIRLIEARVRAQYWFSANLAWPRIWLLTPEAVQAPVRSAHARFDDACVLSGWAVLYLMVGVFWWPAFAIGMVTGAVAWRRARLTADEFATPVESAIDIHWRDLAAALGVTIAGDAISATEGAQLDDRLQKGG